MRVSASRTRAQLRLSRVTTLCAWNCASAITIPPRTPTLTRRPNPCPSQQWWAAERTARLSRNLARLGVDPEAAMELPEGMAYLGKVRRGCVSPAWLVGYQ